MFSHLNTFFPIQVLLDGNIIFDIKWLCHLFDWFRYCNNSAKVEVTELLSDARGVVSVIHYIDCGRQDWWVSDLPGKAAEYMNPRKEAIDLFERLRKLGNLVALTFIVIAQFVAQGCVLFFTIWISVFLGGRNLFENWAYRVARVKEVL